MIMIVIIVIDGVVYGVATVEVRHLFFVGTPKMKNEGATRWTNPVAFSIQRKILQPKIEKIGRFWVPRLKNSDDFGVRSPVMHISV